MLPVDLPQVTIVGTPTRFTRADLPAGGYWEWLRLDLAGGGAIAVFDPDHLCPVNYFGQPCRLAIELFHPIIAPCDAESGGLMPTSAQPSANAPPIVTGRVVARHRYEWRYTGPVTTQEAVGEGARRVVRHVINAPQVTLRLVVDTGQGTLLAQLRDAAEAVPASSWVTLRAGRPELIAIERANECA